MTPQGTSSAPGSLTCIPTPGLTILGEPHHDPKVRQGVTTELVGIDGISHAPFKSREELERYIWLDSGLNGYPPLPADWLTVAATVGQVRRLGCHHHGLQPRHLARAHLERRLERPSGHTR